MCSSRWHGNERIQQSWYFLFYKTTEWLFETSRFWWTIWSDSFYFLQHMHHTSILVIVRNTLLSLWSGCVPCFCRAQLRCSIEFVNFNQLEVHHGLCVCVWECFIFTRFIWIGILVLLILFNFVKWFSGIDIAMTSSDALIHFVHFN